MDDTHPFFSRWYNLDIGSNILSKILIHAPTKGVTYTRKGKRAFCGISIHTPTKGVTKHSGGSSNRLSNFNPHSHEGSDLLILWLSQKRKNFNPHSHEGSDTAHDSSGQRIVDFNPHSHEGSDQSQISIFLAS